MSCLRKRLIQNPILPERRTGFDKQYISVNCGQCPSCRKARQNDWLVRTYFELLNGQHHYCFFVSLDFDNEHLPLYNVERHRFNNYVDRIAFKFSKTLPSYLKPCFDSEELKKFFKRLRGRGYNFRYFCVSEYGGFLHRPHYHIIFFFSYNQDKYSFFRDLQDCWYCGSHEDIEKKGSVNGSIFQALQYVVDYTTKDICFDVDRYESDFPQRYSSRIIASSYYGYSALECGNITPEMIRNNDPVYLPIGKDGKDVAFDIPRYYEMKCFYDYHYHPITRTSELIKNEEGIEAFKYRHNVDYVFFVKNIFASRHDIIPYSVTARFRKLFPDSPYSKMKYHDVILDAMADFDAFKLFAWNLPFFSRRVKSESFPDNHYKLSIFDDTCSNSFYDAPVRIKGMQRMSEAVVYFSFYKEFMDQSQDIYRTYKLIEDTKKRSYAKLKSNPQKYSYVINKGFDIHLLDPEPYHPVDISIKSKIHKFKHKRSVRNNHVIQRYKGIQYAKQHPLPDDIYPCLVDYSGIDLPCVMPFEVSYNVPF